MTDTAKTAIAASFAVAIAAASLLAFATVASADGNERPKMMRLGGENNDIRVVNNNTANVSNKVKVEADTGDNDAEGGDGDDGGRGGDASGDENNTGGNGGNGGNGALGGYIITGGAAAVASIFNEVNVNNTHVDDKCACEDEQRGPWRYWGREDNDIRVSNSSHADVHNDVEVEAETGENDAEGGDGDDGGRGGDASGDDEREPRRPVAKHFWWWTKHLDQDDYNTGGRGGNGGHGGVGGEVFTGDATSGAEVMNVVNRNVTRVTRGN